MGRKGYPTTDLRNNPQLRRPRRYHLFYLNAQPHLTVPAHLMEDLDHWRPGSWVSLSVEDHQLWVIQSPTPTEQVLRSYGSGSLMFQVPEALQQVLGWTPEEALRARPTYADGLIYYVPDEEARFDQAYRRQLRVPRAMFLTWLSLTYREQLGGCEVAYASLYQEQPAGRAFNQLPLTLNLLLQLRPPAPPGKTGSPSPPSSQAEALGGSPPPEEPSP